MPAMTRACKPSGAMTRAGIVPVAMTPDDRAQLPMKSVRPQLTLVAFYP